MKSAYKELVMFALNNNHTVSVFDGEEWPVKKSRKYFDILEAIESVEEARVIVRNEAGDKLFWALIIPFGVEPDETIADCSDNAFSKSFEAYLEA